MKNLKKIPRNFGAKFCYFGVESNGYKEVNEANEVLPQQKLRALKEDVKNTPDSAEYSNEKTIDSALDAAQKGEKMPNGFEKIPASEFLKRSAEELNRL